MEQKRNRKQRPRWQAGVGVFEWVTDYRKHVTTYRGSFSPLIKCKLSAYIAARPKIRMVYWAGLVQVQIQLPATSAKPQGRTMKIHLKRLTGQIITLDVDKSDTVEELKGQIARRTGKNSCHENADLHSF